MVSLLSLFWAAVNVTLNWERGGRREPASQVVGEIFGVIYDEVAHHRDRARKRARAWLLVCLVGLPSFVALSFLLPREPWLGWLVGLWWLLVAVQRYHRGRADAYESMTIKLSIPRVARQMASGPSWQGEPALVDQAEQPRDAGNVRLALSLVMFVFLVAAGLALLVLKITREGLAAL